MSVTKAELVQINQKHQEEIKRLSGENHALRLTNQALTESLACLTQQSEALTLRFQRLAHYTRTLRDWLSDREGSKTERN